MISAIRADLSGLLKDRQQNGMLAAWAFEGWLLVSMSPFFTIKPFGYGFE